MSAVRHGAQWASGSEASPLQRAPLRDSRPPLSSPRARRWAPTFALAVALAIASIATAPPAPARAADYLLMPRSELLSLPVSGTAWSNLKKVADSSLGTPNLCDQNSDHHLRTLAAALVYARTGTASYGTKARSGVMAALPTQTPGCGNAVLALGRQLPAYVLAADLANLSGSNETTFRSWLSAIRTKNIGGHNTWYTLTGTHKASANNWGAYAGAARIAASLYLGDTTDVANAAKVTRGFLGDRTSYAGFTMQLDSTDLSWSCWTQSTYTPENRACTKSGINLDGAVVTDISRGGALHWPPLDPGISYQLETIQGLGLQVELLYRNGYSTAWTWSNSAMKRMAAVVTRSAASGGDGWNQTQASRQMPWLLNLRYGTSIPTQATGMGRAIGFTDWLYGKGRSSSPPPPTSSGTAPVTTAPSVRVARTSVVPKTGVRTFVSWSLVSSSNGVSRYDLQVSTNGGSYRTLTLATRTSRSRWVTLSTSATYQFRVRAVDKSGRVGAWKYIGKRQAARYGDRSTTVGYSGTWRTASSTNYLGGTTRYTKSAGATARFTFTGTSVAWVGPKGPTRGKAYVYIDGTRVATVDLYAASFHSRVTVFAVSVPYGKHTLTVKALGTSGRPTVAIDAFTLIRPR